LRPCSQSEEKAEVRSKKAELQIADLKKSEVRIQKAEVRRQNLKVEKSAI
jgi:hypothetical protein